MPAPRIVICGAGVIGASVAYFLTRRGAPPLIVDRCRPAAAASGKASGFIASDWNAGTPLDAMSRASFALHAELADALGRDRIGFRPVDVLAVAASDGADVERYRKLPSPDWLDGNVAAHAVIGDTATTAQVSPQELTRALVDEAVAGGADLLTGVVDGLALDGPGGAVTAVSIDGSPHPADVVVLALGPWTRRAQHWLALPQVLDTRMASILLAAELPAQVVFSEFLGRDGGSGEYRLYPRADATVYVTGVREHVTLPDDPKSVGPKEASCDELHRVAGAHSSVLRHATVLARTACHRPLTVDGLPLVGPVEDAPGVYLATAHASWGILNAPATGRMVAEMILDGGSHSLDASPFALARLPAGRL